MEMYLMRFICYLLGNVFLTLPVAMAIITLTEVTRRVSLSSQDMATVHYSSEVTALGVEPVTFHP